MTASASEVETLAAAGLEWLRGLARDTEDGLVWAGSAEDDEVDLTLYSGAAIVHSGLPARVRPGFWDNSGRCCGTAGVLALACDRYAEGCGDLEFANVLVDDLASRATVDDAGARWSNHEHRATPSALPPCTGWAMGNAGIVRELMRHARSKAGADPSYSVTWPDHPPCGRPELRFGANQQCPESDGHRLLDLATAGVGLRLLCQVDAPVAVVTAWQCRDSRPEDLGCRLMLTEYHQAVGPLCFDIGGIQEQPPW